MEAIISRKSIRTTLIIFGLMIGIVIASSAQSLHQFAGTYTTEKDNMQVSITSDGAGVIISNKESVQAKLELKRLIDKIKVIDVTTYFYEVTIKADSRNQIKTIELVYNDSSGKAFIDIPGYSFFEKVKSI